MWASLDMSANWSIIVLVLWRKRFPALVHPHIASYGHSRRIKIIDAVLRWISDCNAWGFIYIGNILRRVKMLTLRRHPKSYAWRVVLGDVFSRILLEIRTRSLELPSIIYADKEFQYHERVIRDVFKSEVYVGKYSELIPADVLAYTTYAGLLPKNDKIITISRE